MKRSAAGFLAIFWLGSAAYLSAEIATDSHIIRPDSINQGGDRGISFTSHELGQAVGEVSGSTFTFSSHVLYPGLMHLISFPETVLGLSGTVQSSTTVRLDWNSPGYDGAIGALQTGTGYYVQHSTWGGIAWSFADAQTIISTTSVSPGSAQSKLINNLSPNTTYFFRLWTKDAEGNISDLSNGASAGTLAVAPQNVTNKFLMTGVSSITVAWAALPTVPSSSTAEGYRLEASTTSNFSGTLYSSATTNVLVSTLTVGNLSSNTTYYFRVGSIDWSGNTNFSLMGSTLTQVSVDLTAPNAVSDVFASTQTASSLVLRWSAPIDATDNPLTGNYKVQYATWSGVNWSTANAQITISTSGVSPGALQSTNIEGLNPNTTYFLHLWTSDSKPNWSALSNGATVVTLSNPVADISISSVFTTSATVTWTPLPLSPSSATALGYRLEASSTDFNGSGSIYSSGTTNVSLSALSLLSLAANTTYYFRVASLNRNNVPNYLLGGSTSTLANAPVRLVTDFLNVYSSSITAHWAALQASPLSQTSEGYRLEASSTNFNGTGILFSSVTTSVALSTLTVSSLDPSTIYSFRVGSLNHNGVPNYTVLDATSSLANIPTDSIFTSVLSSSAALTWSIPSGGAQGYRMEASSTNFDGTGTVLSSTTNSASLTSLVVSTLFANTTYFFRVGSLNQNGVPNFSSSLSTSTLANVPNRLTTDFLSVYASSITARWAALPAGPLYLTSEGYRVEASSTNFNGSGLVYSSSTGNVALSTLTVLSFGPNTTYYFRVGSLNHNNVANFTTLSATSTLVNAPISVASTFTLVGISSITTQWSANGNPAVTLYTLQLSTNSNFSNAVTSSATYHVSATLTGLAPNATYYAQVKATNNNGVSSAYATLGSTITRGSAPGFVSPAFNPVNISSLTVSYSDGGNPSDTSYTVQLSSNADYSNAVSSTTLKLVASFTVLSPNTTYFARVRSINRTGTFSDFTSMGSTVTLAVPPGLSVSTYANLTYNSFSLNWSSGSTSTGYNPEGTFYNVQISLNSGFSSIDQEITVADVSVTFNGLISNTPYYARVRALNQQNIPSNFTTYGSTSTLPSSIPVFLAGTFQVSNSQGQFIDSSLYTDTTTPSLRVQVQSNVSPGLSVTDTPSHLALWHLDEGSGSSVVDNSNHSKSLSLVNAPSWISGQLGNAVSFNGSNQYGTSVNLTPWRNAAATNQWAVSLWFRTALGRGFLFQVADGTTLASSPYDAEISWDDATGNLAFEVNQGNTRRYIQAGTSYADSAWHFVTAVLNTSGMYLFVDGAQVAFGNQVLSSSARTYSGPIYAWIGAATTQGANMGGGNFQYYPGDIDEVLITNVPLSVSQHTTLYNLGNSARVGLGAPNVDISTQSGANSTWVRTSTNSVSMTGTNGTTAAQLFSSTFSLSGLSLRQTTTPGADTNRVNFIASALDANQATAQYTILVDTTPPTGQGISSLVNISSSSVAVNVMTAADGLSGLDTSPYRVDASTDSGFSAVQTSGFISLSSYSFAGLMPNSTYYFRVVAKDAAGNVSSPSTSVSTVTWAKSLATISLMQVYQSSASLTWDVLPLSPSSATVYGYRLEASSTNFNGTGVIRSSESVGISLSTLTVSSLASNTTTYFRVATLNWLKVATYSQGPSTSTLTGVPTAGSAMSIMISSITAAWSAPTGGAQGYRFEVSSTNFSGFGTIYSSVTTSVAVTTLTATGLDPNTTYYFRIGAKNHNGVYVYATLSATSTLTNRPSSAFFSGVFVSSVSIQWTSPVGGSTGFFVEASLSDDYSNPITAVTEDDNATAIFVEGLTSNTTYYFRVASVNWNEIRQFADVGSTATLTSTDFTAPEAVNTLAASTLTATSLRLEWNAPSDATDNPLTGQYAIQYATWTGVVWATANAQIMFSTTSVTPGETQRLELAGLLSNTSYYVKLWTSDARPNWSPESNQEIRATLAPSLQSISIVSISTDVISIGWAAIPASPQDQSSHGYRLEASTSINFSGTVFLSSTTALDQSTLTVSGLLSNTTYYLRAASLNLVDDANYSTVFGTSTLARKPVSLSTDFLNVYPSSVTARWTASSANPQETTTEGYRLEASSTNFSGSGILYSSVTTNVSVSTLTIISLDANTTYYFRVGSLNWNRVANFTTLTSTSSLANTPVSLSSTFTAVNISSITAQWSSNGNPAGTVYVLQISTNSDFSALLQSSSTLRATASFTGLNPNTTHFFRVQATNNNSVSTPYLSLGSTVTVTSPPESSVMVFDPVHISSLAVNFAQGIPINPAGTVFEIDLSSASDFAIGVTSNTVLTSATFTSLSPNTTYFSRGRSLNLGGVPSAYADFGSTATLAMVPGVVSSSFTDVAFNAFTLKWSSGSAAAGYNPAGTIYQAQISLNSGFSSVDQELFVTDLAATFNGLISNTAYYGRVRAINHQSIVTDFINYGSTTTQPSAIPVFLAGTFEVTNSQGQYIDPSLYTDTTTPSVRVQVQSNYAPGLAVTETPSHLALWHLDDGSGSLGTDASKHSKTLTLINSPSWISGKMTGALDFDGSSEYATSANLTPWRNSAGNNQWSVSLWFRTSLGRGFLFQTASVDTLGGSTYDAELSWYDATGKLAFEVTTSGGTRQYVQASGTYTDGNWHFVTAVLNASGMVIYVDGSQVGSGTAVNSNTARVYAGPTYAWIGAATTQGANMGGGNFQYYPGDIDDVLISTVAYSLSQHTDLFNLGNKGIAMGSPAFEISTQEGGDGTWIRSSTDSISITGTRGTTSAQIFTSTLSLSALSLIQTTAPGADTNRAAFIATSLDSNQTAAYYTILVDTTPPIGAGVSSLVDISSSAVTVNLLTASDGLSGLDATPYRVEISTDPGFTVSQNSGFMAELSTTFSNLLTNTTYFVRVEANDAAGNTSIPSSSTSTVTLAKPVTNVLVDGVYFSSITYTWSPRPISPSSETAKAYLVQISTLSDFSVIRSSDVLDAQTSSWTANDLYGHTTYYFRVGSLNWIDAVNYSLDVSTFVSRQLNIAMSTDTVGAGQHAPNTIVLISTPIIVTNGSNTPATYLFRTTTTASEYPWQIGPTQDLDQFILWMIVSDTEPLDTDFSDEDKLSDTDIQCTSVVFAQGSQTCVSIPPGEQRTMWFRIGFPMVVHAAAEQTIRVVGTAGASD